jgi:hypothetical protein
MLLAIGPLIEDKRFRRVTGPGVFTAVANTVPITLRLTRFGGVRPSVQAGSAHA